MDKFYTVQEVAEMFKVNIHTVYRWIKEGRLNAVKVGDLVRITESELNKFIDSYKK
ncbi:MULTISPECIES: helix-turn-helix domain-containing protein [Thermoanaerobacterium]|uniref:helix-turn-helix domain-containing protein n=1 Tax=Thermoanaerobacterium TaxID=28895 RepID=UPI00123C52BA|nr:MULTISPECIES: helix-turn-helix domain-containing protein [Thermoanaerobacterium]KAA5805957.1 helix-turn-helix domain-containing protein [Thermoanaerobacterium thermosaccharolyticum]MDE4543418.1 helix-turn-helix domain-containing protein [Thermoanaerobacterium sp. R66]